MYGNMFVNPYAAQIGQQSSFMPTMQAPTQSLTPPAASPAFLQVGTVKEFDSVTIQPGRQVLIMAQNDPYIAFKCADAMGMVTTNLYRLEPVTSEQINGPSVEYATKEELSKLQIVVHDLIENIGKAEKKKEAAE